VAFLRNIQRLPWHFACQTETQGPHVEPLCSGDNCGGELTVLGGNHGDARVARLGSLSHFGPVLAQDSATKPTHGKFSMFYPSMMVRREIQRFSAIGNVELAPSFN
jgi:hypothetical protein